MDENILDAILFRYWITAASVKPSKVAKAIMNCLTPNEYRKALIELAKEDGINLPV